MTAQEAVKKLTAMGVNFLHDIDKHAGPNQSRYGWLKATVGEDAADDIMNDCAIRASIQDWRRARKVMP